MPGWAGRLHRQAPENKSAAATTIYNICKTKYTCEKVCPSQTSEFTDDVNPFRFVPCGPPKPARATPKIKHHNHNLVQFRHLKFDQLPRVPSLAITIVPVNVSFTYRHQTPPPTVMGPPGTLVEYIKVGSWG